MKRIKTDSRKMIVRYDDTNLFIISHLFNELNSSDKFISVTHLSSNDKKIMINDHDCKHDVYLISIFSKCKTVMYYDLYQYIFGL